MRFTRRRSDRPEPARRSLGTSLEVLEGRALLSSTNVHPYLPFLPSDLPVSNPVTHQQIPFFSVAPLAHQARLDPQAQFVNNEGKIVSGKDRQGNEWTITVHGPGAVIVTDISPNDGILDDNIDTIQLVGTDPRKTYVTGQTVASARVLTSGTVLFNRLIDTSGVKSIVLNGFTLQETVTPPGAAASENASLFLNTGIYLTGGVGLLRDASTSGRRFLVNLLDPVVGLLPEFPGSNTYWLFHDNDLAVTVSSRAGPGVADKVRGTIHGRRIAESGEVEIVFGEAKPPLSFHHHRLLEANVETPSSAVLGRSTG